jgi:putative glutamine amidotransferase
VTRAVIGLTTYRETARWGPWHSTAVLAPATYVDAIDRAGGRAVLIPPGDDTVLDVVDGLVFAGGSDIDPSLYGQTPHPETDQARSLRDAGEAALLSRALERDVPTLCICRGAQLLNVVRGGDLVQHLPDITGDRLHKEEPGVYSAHEVAIKPDSLLGSILGPAVEVQSHHHQAPARIGDRLEEVAWAPDGIVEGIEDEALRFCVGVVWHPEERGDLRLFEALIDRARA